MIHRFVASVGERQLEVSVEKLDGGKVRVEVDGRARLLDARRVENGTWSLLPEDGGPARLVDVDGRGADYVATIAAQSIALKLVEGRRAAVAQVAGRAAKAGPQAVRSPMPGKVVKVLVASGDAVTAGQGVAVVEAMKMENELRAPRDGTIKEVHAKDGQAVEAGQVLVTIE